MLDYGCDGGDGVVNICSKDFFGEIKIFVDLKESIHEVRVKTKYKMVAKKMKLVWLSLLLDCEEKIGKISMQPNMRDPRKIGHKFTDSNLDGLKTGNDIFIY